MGLPKLLFYHFAFSLWHIAQWSLPPEQAPSWSSIVQDVCLTLTSLADLSIKLSSRMQSHPVLSHLQDKWQKVAKIHDIDIHLNSKSNTWFNLMLCIGTAPFLCKVWSKKKGSGHLGICFKTICWNFLKSKSRNLVSLDPVCGSIYSWGT